MIFIDGQPIASRNIVEEFELAQVVLEELAFVISFNIIRSHEHSIFLGLPWIELHNRKIDWQT